MAKSKLSTKYKKLASNRGQIDIEFNIADAEYNFSSMTKSQLVNNIIKAKGGKSNSKRGNARMRAVLKGKSKDELAHLAANEKKKQITKKENNRLLKSYRTILKNHPYLQGQLSYQDFVNNISTFGTYARDYDYEEAVSMAFVPGYKPEPDQLDNIDWDAY